jgi:hypothetical protein
MPSVIDFNNLCTLLLEAGHGRLNQFSALRCDLIGRVEIVEVAHRKAEIAVERIDQDFKGRLQGIAIAVAFRIFGSGREFLRLHAKTAQIAQQTGEYVQFIFTRQVVVSQHDRRIERSNVAVEHASRHSLMFHARIAADDIPALVRPRDRMALVKIFPQEERIDFGRVPAQGYVLIRIRKNLRLDEIAGRQ